MDPVTKKRNALLSEKIIKGLATRNMNGYYAETKEEALKMALDLIPEGSTVTRGGCLTSAQIGLDAALKDGNYDFIEREKFEDQRKAMLLAYDSDVYLASANAITEDGIIVNIDGNSNRVSAIAYGPKKVVFLVGMNKVAKDVDSAVKRARNVAAPVNALRLNRNTPCTKTGSCMNCLSPDTICCNFMITRFSRAAGRIHVILINEELGF
jgi:L-lactate utilization protein LutB